MKTQGDNNMSLLGMSKDLLNIAIPVIIGLIVSIAVELVNVAFIGHLGDPAKVAGIGLGNMYINMFS